MFQQRSREHFNLLILFSSKFNNFVTLAKHKVKTPYRCIETCRSAYGIQNIVNKQGVPLATEPGISLIILTPMKILQ